MPTTGMRGWSNRCRKFAAGAASVAQRANPVSRRAISSSGSWGWVAFILRSSIQPMMRKSRSPLKSAAPRSISLGFAPDTSSEDPVEPANGVWNLAESVGSQGAISNVARNIRKENKRKDWKRTRPTHRQLPVSADGEVARTSVARRLCSSGISHRFCSAVRSIRG